MATKVEWVVFCRRVPFHSSPCFPGAGTRRRTSNVAAHRCSWFYRKPFFLHSTKRVRHQMGWRRMLLFFDACLINTPGKHSSLCSRGMTLGKDSSMRQSSPCRLCRVSYTGSLYRVFSSVRGAFWYTTEIAFLCSG
jgi:hypothetical protein